MKTCCIDCFFRIEDNGQEFCSIDPENLKEINFFDPACKSFEISEEAERENRLQPGEIK